MKKIALIILSLLCITSTVNAYDYTEQDKKEFYEALSDGFFEAVPNELIKTGFTKNSSFFYAMKLKQRFYETGSLNKLEKATWGCFSQYSPEYMMSNQDKVLTECNAIQWMTDFVKENNDLDSILKLENN